MRYLFLLFFFSGYAQIVTYSGTITEGGKPLPGVSICVKNMPNCTTSDFNGNYSIEVKIGDQLIISSLGMVTRYVTVTEALLTAANNVAVQHILSNDFSNSIKQEEDTLQVTQPSGTTLDLYQNRLTYYDVVQIKKDPQNQYSFVNSNAFYKLYLELYSEFTAGVPMRRHNFQNQYAQGRSLNGVATYQGPQTNEMFSWGPSIATLQTANYATPYYPNGDIIPQNSAGGNPVGVYGRNSFFRNTFYQKTTFSAKLQMPGSSEYLKLNVSYRSSANTIPTGKNDEINTAFSYSKNINSHSLSANAHFNRFVNRLSNANFIYNKAIFANAITPSHFDSRAGSLLPDGQPRNFSRIENNPYYLLEYNLDESSSSQIGLSLVDTYINNDIENTVKVVSQISDIENTGGNIPLAAQVTTPDYNLRKEKYSLLSLSDDFKHHVGGNNYISAKFNLRYQDRGLNRTFYEGFGSLASYPYVSDNQYSIEKNQDRLELGLNLNGSYEIDYFLDSDRLTFNASVDGLFSTTYKNNLYANATAGFDWVGIIASNLNLYGNASYKQYEPDLQNNNLYFNSLAYGLDEFKQMRNNRELFAPDATATTTRETNYIAGLRYHWPVRIDLEVYLKKVSDLYAPISQGGSFVWLPAADYNQRGLEVTLWYDYFKYNANNLQFSNSLNFTTYKNKVTALSQNTSRIPIAGFADVNKNYMVNQPLGVLVGSRFERDANNNVVIDSQGFPIVASEPGVIGDPNPDFVLGLSNTLMYRKFSLKINFDWSKGGDLWNGTAQTLNYYGVSALTAAQRNVTGYVFNGVTQNGQPNTQPVAFYDTSQPVEQNRWVRYGVGGVAEEAIEDASYFRLNNITLSYSNEIPYHKNSLNFTVSAFVNNVFIISKSDTAFSGNSLFNSSETSGLDYFNAPMLRMYGLSVGVKF